LRRQPRPARPHTPLSKVSDGQHADCVRACVCALCHVQAKGWTKRSPQWPGRWSREAGLFPARPASP
jgi:hypothetical protein